ncbi:hypothetical protein JHK85_027341 [Glycine max]|nr:hypothetical protein JHK85_027341 [Glycine max]
MGKILRETARPFSNCSSSSASPLSAPPATTSSTSLTDTVRGSHRFKITGYSLSKGIGIGKYIASDIFSVGGYDWAIYFYPDGKSVEDNATYVSLFIALASEGTDVRALFELTLLDQSGKERHKVHSHFERTLESGPYTLKYRGSMWGYKRFFKRTALETSDYLKDDCLSVNCSVGVVKSHTEGPKIYKIPIPSSNMGQQFGKLLESGKDSDVSFEVNGEIFAAHKLVLAARSPVFRAQLFGPMKNQNTHCIKVEDMEAPVFKLENVLVTLSVHALICTLSFMIFEDIFLAFPHIIIVKHNVATELYVDVESYTSFVLPTFFSPHAFIYAANDAYIAVMQTDGFEYLKESCPSVLTELLEYVARFTEHSDFLCKHRNELILDGSDVNGRRVKQRL